jgi:hypothetical protein
MEGVKMIKYVMTKQIEIDEDSYEEDVIEVLDTKEAAKQAAEKVFDEMPDHEKLFYEIVVWEVPEEWLEEKDDWGSFTCRKRVMIISTEAKEYKDESSEEIDNGDYCDPDNIVHFCVSPLQDGVRLWVGDDPDKYVDRVLMGFPGVTGECLENWFKKYGIFQEESWEECFPESERKKYIRRIRSRGKSYEEALEILRYLPQTDSILAEENVSKIVCRDFDASQLEMLFSSRDKDGNKIEAADRVKAEAEVLGLINSMKHESTDQEGEQAA